MTTLSTELFRTLIEQHPIDTALVLERYPYEESWGLLAQLPLETQAEIVEAFHSEYAAELLLALNSEQRFALIRELPSQISSDILEHFSDPLREEVVTALPSLHQEELELLDSFEEIMKLASRFLICFTIFGLLHLANVPVCLCVHSAVPRFS